MTSAMPNAMKVVAHAICTALGTAINATQNRPPTTIPDSAAGVTHSAELPDIKRMFDARDFNETAQSTRTATDAAAPRAEREIVVSINVAPFDPHQGPAALGTPITGSRG